MPDESETAARPSPREPEPEPARPFLKPGSATIDDFRKLDLRVGRIVDARELPGARVPAYQLVIDFGPGGIRRSSARLTGTYPDPAGLVGRSIVAVVNFPPRRVAGFISEVLVLGALSADGRIPLLGVDEGASPGIRSADAAPKRGPPPRAGAQHGRASVRGQYPYGVCGIGVARPAERRYSTPSRRPERRAPDPQSPPTARYQSVGSS